MSDLGTVKGIVIDACFLCGLGLIGWGLWEYSPWVSKTTVGSLLLLLGFYLNR